MFVVQNFTQNPISTGLQIFLLKSGYYLLVTGVILLILGISAGSFLSIPLLVRFMADSSIQSVFVPSGGKGTVYLDVDEPDRPLVLAVKTNNSEDKLSTSLLTPDGAKIMEETFTGQTVISGVKTVPGRYTVEVTNPGEHEVGVDIIFGFLTGSGDDQFIKALSGTAISSIMVTFSIVLMIIGGVIAMMNRRYVQRDGYRKFGT